MFALSTKIYQARHFLRHLFVAKRGGHGVHSPFAYRLCEEVFYNKAVFYDFVELQKIREGLLHNEQVLEIEDHGAGSKTFKNKKRAVSNIAKRGISSARQSEFIYRLINFLNCKNSVEIGTSLGLNSLYIARANPNGTVSTIEGSYALYTFARHLGNKLEAGNIKYIHANFDVALPGVFKDLKSLDFLYMDGNHTYEATLRYFRMALPYKHGSSVFMIDDIYWSAEMTRAWREIRSDRSVTMSIDCFYFGLVFFKQDIKEKVDLNFYI